MFPGHVSVNNVKLERKLDVNEITLRQIGSGIPAVMVQGSVDFDWRTMVPENMVQSPAEELGQ